MRLVQGTTHKRAFRLYDSRKVAANLTASTVVLEMEPDPAGNAIERSCTITNHTGGIVECAPASDPATPVGVYRCRFKVTFGDMSVDYFPDERFDIVVVAA